MAAFPLESFLDAAASGDYVGIGEGLNGPAVIALGKAPNGAQVAWIDTSKAGSLPREMADATAMFLDALEQSYGRHISEIVKNGLRLNDHAGRPLASPLVKRAVELAKASQSLYAGMNFMSRIHFSATRGGAEFARACAKHGTSAQELGPGRRAYADYLFDQSFQSASRGDTVYVPPEKARQLFEDAVAQAMAVSEDVAAKMAKPSNERPS